MSSRRVTRGLVPAVVVALLSAVGPVLAAPSPTPDWTRPGGRDFAQLGFSVAGAGDVDGDGYADILLGAPFQDSNVGGNGAVYLFRGGPAGPEATPSWSYLGTGAIRQVGFAVAAAGDLNGDGYDDVAVSAPGNGGTAYVLVFQGGPTGLPAAPSAILQGYGLESEYGDSVAGAGDVNGDGYDDLLVGAPGYRGYGTYGPVRGRVFVYLGSSYGISYSPATELDPGQNNSRFGFAVAGVGDLDADGFDDILVGDTAFDLGSDPGDDRGKVSLYRGSASGLVPVPAWSALGAHPHAKFGRSIARGGDINGDGFPDVVVGSPWWDPSFNPYTDSRTYGRVDVFYGSATGLGAAPGWSSYGVSSGDGLGYYVSGGADVNGDGYADIVTGAHGVTHPEYQEGEAFLYYGGASGPGVIPTWTAESNRPSGEFGFPIAFAGDTNGDSLADLLLGCDQYNNGFSHEGTGFLYFGRPTSNLAPHAAIAPVAPQECSGPGSGLVALDGSGSTDRNSTPGSNDDIVAFDWYEAYGTPAARLLGSGEIIQAILALGSHQVTLVVTDAAGQQATAASAVVVVDTAPPALAVGVAPTSLWPPNHRMVEVQAQVVVADVCGAATFELVSVVSNEPDDAPGEGDGRTLGDVAGAGEVPGDTTFLIRAERSATGDGRIYTATYRATDASGNTRTAAATVVVPLTRNGVSEPLIQTAEEGPAGTLLAWAPVPEATVYDVVRGDLDALADAGDRIDLGSPICLASGITEVSSAGHEDSALPALGKGFFYLVQYHGPKPVSFGTDSAAKPRLPSAGGCP